MVAQQDPVIYRLEGQRVFLAGHQGMVGSALLRRLNGIDCKVLTAARDQLDLTRQTQVEQWFATQQPDCVIVAAAKVGGILANATHPAEFLYQNLLIEANLVHAAHRADVDRLLFLGSSCIYPRLAAQPIAESQLLSGELEPTNEAYAIAKIAGIKLCQAYRQQYERRYIAAMPTNLYGPNDNFDLDSSHVIPALIHKFSLAKQNNQAAVQIWGSGRPRREFMHVDDLADALLHILVRYDDAEPINVGVGEDISIAALAELVANTVRFSGRLDYDVSKPDGTPRKLLDSSKLFASGWSPKISLKLGLTRTAEWFQQHRPDLRDV